MASVQQPKEFTQEEQGRYDRQIRLWGLDAQQRMRNATILMVHLRGTATEAIKNIVLAGIGKLIIVDGEPVTEEDLGAGFFFRDEDVGKQRVVAAKARIESLNPLVQVEVITSLDALSDDKTAEATLRMADIVCVTDSDRQELVRLNQICRRLNKPIYTGGTFGLLGYIFCDLLEHEYIAPNRSAPVANEVARTVKVSSSYVPLHEALQYKWSSLTKRQTKELNPAAFFTVLAIWEYQAVNGTLPDDPQCANDLQTIANDLASAADVNKIALPSVPAEIVQPLATSAAHEFSPICAVVGGMLAQDILKALARREAAISNFFVFDGTTGAGTVCKMNMA